MEDTEIRSKFESLDNRVDEIEKQLPVINERYKTMNDLFQKNIAVLDKLEGSFQDNRETSAAYFHMKPCLEGSTDNGM